MMASPLIKHIKKAVSPKSPLMRLKSPLKGRLPKRFLQAQKPLFCSVFSLSPKKLVADEVPTLSVPEVRSRLNLEPNITSLLESGTKGKNVYILGKGSFGTVILSSLKGEAVAVKIVNNNSGQSTVNRELNALILSHPNIIDVIQVIHNPRKPFGIVVMELGPPLTLQAIIDQTTKISFQDCIRLSVGITKALGYCHDVGIVHLDVKPKNILINLQDMNSKLCDFGNSQHLRSSAESSYLQGTVAYIAPELLKGQPVTDKCDVYSFGITMWQIIHKENPYSGIDNHVIIYQVVANHLRPETSIQSIEMKSFIKLYEKCWQEDPSQRPSMSTVGSCLMALL